MKLFDIRCPLPRKDSPDKQCNRLCVRVTAGSSGEAHCPRHDARFEFQIDKPESIGVMIRDREATQRDPIATSSASNS